MKQKTFGEKGLDLHRGSFEMAKKDIGSFTAAHEDAWNDKNRIGRFERRALVRKLMVRVKKNTRVFYHHGTI